MDDSASYGTDTGFAEPLAIDVIETSGLEPGGEPFVTSTERFLDRRAGTPLGPDGGLGATSLAFADRILSWVDDSPLLSDPLARMGGLAAMGIGSWMTYFERLAGQTLEGYWAIAGPEMAFLPFEGEGDATEERLWTVWKEQQEREQTEEKKRDREKERAQRRAADASASRARDEAKAPRHAQSRDQARQQLIEVRAQQRLEARAEEREQRRAAQEQRSALALERAQARRIADQETRAQRLEEIDRRDRTVAQAETLRRERALLTLQADEAQRDEQRERATQRARLRRLAGVAQDAADGGLAAQVESLLGLAQRAGASPVPPAVVDALAERVAQVHRQTAARAAAERRTAQREATERRAATATLASLQALARDVPDPALQDWIARAHAATVSGVTPPPRAEELASVAQRVAEAQRVAAAASKDRVTTEQRQEVQRVLAQQEARVEQRRVERVRRQVAALGRRARTLPDPGLRAWVGKLALAVLAEGAAAPSEATLRVVEQRLDEARSTAAAHVAAQRPTALPVTGRAATTQPPDAPRDPTDGGSGADPAQGPLAARLAAAAAPAGVLDVELKALAALPPGRRAVAATKLRDAVRVARVSGANLPQLLSRLLRGAVLSADAGMDPRVGGGLASGSGGGGLARGVLRAGRALVSTVREMEVLGEPQLATLRGAATVGGAPSTPRAAGDTATRPGGLVAERSSAQAAERAAEEAAGLAVGALTSAVATGAGAQALTGEGVGALTAPQRQAVTEAVQAAAETASRAATNAVAQQVASRISAQVARTAALELAPLAARQAAEALNATFFKGLAGPAALTAAAATASATAERLVQQRLSGQMAGLAERVASEAMAAIPAQAIEHAAAESAWRAASAAIATAVRRSGPLASSAELRALATRAAQTAARSAARRVAAELAESAVRQVGRQVATAAATAWASAAARDATLQGLVALRQEPPTAGDQPPAPGAPAGLAGVATSDVSGAPPASEDARAAQLTQRGAGAEAFSARGTGGAAWTALQRSIAQQLQRPGTGRSALARALGSRGGFVARLVSMGLVSPERMGRTDPTALPEPMRAMLTELLHAETEPALRVSGRASGTGAAGRVGLPSLDLAEQRGVAPRVPTPESLLAWQHAGRMGVQRWSTARAGLPWSPQGRTQEGPSAARGGQRGPGVWSQLEQLAGPARGHAEGRPQVGRAAERPRHTGPELPPAVRAMLPAGTSAAALQVALRLGGPGFASRGAGAGAALPLPELERWFRWHGETKTSELTGFLRWLDWGATSDGAGPATASAHRAPSAPPGAVIAGISEAFAAPQRGASETVREILKTAGGANAALATALPAALLDRPVQELPVEVVRWIRRAAQSDPSRAAEQEALLAQLPAGISRSVWTTATFRGPVHTAPAPGRSGRTAANFVPLLLKAARSHAPSLLGAASAFLPSGMVANLLSHTGAQTPEARLLAALVEQLPADATTEELQMTAQAAARPLLTALLANVGLTRVLPVLTSLARAPGGAAAPAALRMMRQAMHALRSRGASGLAAALERSLPATLAAALQVADRHVVAHDEDPGRASDGPDVALSGTAPPSGGGERAERLAAALPSLGFLGFPVMPALAHAVDRRLESGLLAALRSGVASMGYLDLLGAAASTGSLPGAVLSVFQARGIRAAQLVQAGPAAEALREALGYGPAAPARGPRPSAHRPGDAGTGSDGSLAALSSPLERGALAALPGDLRAALGAAAPRGLATPTLARWLQGAIESGRFTEASQVRQLVGALERSVALRPLARDPELVRLADRVGAAAATRRARAGRQGRTEADERAALPGVGLFGTSRPAGESVIHGGLASAADLDASAGSSRRVGQALPGVLERWLAAAAPTAEAGLSAALSRGHLSDVMQTRLLIILRPLNVIQNTRFGSVLI